MAEDFNFMNPVMKGFSVLIVAVLMVTAIGYIQVSLSDDDSSNPNNPNSTSGVVRVNHVDIFQDCLALDANHVVAAEDLSAGSPITCTIATQPDVPRIFSWILTHAQITEYTMVFVGVDAKGNVTNETVTEADGWTGETDNAFAKITSVTFTRDAGTGAGDTLDVGIADKLGLSNPFTVAADVYKVKEGGADYTDFTVDATYHTVSIDGVIGAWSDYTIWFRTNLTISS